MERSESVRSPWNFLLEAAEKYESYPAVFYGGNVWSYSDIKSMAGSLSEAIMDRFSVKKGDIIGVCLPQSVQSILSYFALWKKGLVPVPIDSRLPVSAIDRIVSSGKISGIITYEGLYSKINREDTSSIFNLLTEPGDFLAHFQDPPEGFLIYRPKGTRQRAVLEESCYGEEGESEKIDPYTDPAIANIVWKSNGSFSIVKFTAGEVVEASRKYMEKLISRENSTFIQAHEPSDAQSVILSYIYPLHYGHGIGMESLYDENDLKAVEKKYSSESSFIFNVNSCRSDFLRDVEKKERSQISLIFSRGIMGRHIIESLKEKRSSVFTLLCDEHLLVPLYWKQESESGKFVRFIENEEDVKLLERDGNIMASGTMVSVSEDEYVKTDIFVTESGLEERIILDENVIISLGKSYPVKDMEELIKNEMKIEDLKIVNDGKKIILKSSEKLNRKTLREIFSRRVPPEIFRLIED